MVNIDKAHVSEYTITGEFDIASDVEGLKTTLRFVLNNTPLSEVIQSMLKDKRINKQVHIRAHPSEYKHGSIVRVPFTGGRMPIDPEQAMADKLRAMSPDERAKYLMEKFGLSVLPTAPPIEPLT